MSQWSLFFVIYNGDHHDIIHGVPHTNIIRFEKIDRIRIRILFGLKKSTEYEYEYYSVWKYRPNTNTNIIRFEKITRIRIRILVFGLNYSNNIRIPNYSLTSGQLPKGFIFQHSLNFKSGILRLKKFANHHLAIKIDKKIVIWKENQ